MSPANQLKAAIQSAEQAIGRMHAEGNLSIEAALDVVDCLADLKTAVDELPDRICEFEMASCSTCPLYYRDRSYEPYGDGTALNQFLECRAKLATDCPAVNACGFVDESKPENVVPLTFQRQAE